MKQLLALLSILLFAGSQNVFGQCNTTNATSCACATPGATNCDLLPDIITARPPLLVQGNNGVIEYAQVGNGANNGRLRVSVSSPNIGHGPLEIRATNTFICGTDTFVGTAPTTCPNTGLPPRTLVVQRVYQKNGNTMNYYDRHAGSMTYHPTHGHMHVDEWGSYSLRTMSNDPDPMNWPIVGEGAKLAFCLMDYGSCSTYNGHCVDSLGNTLVNSNFPNYGLGGGNYGCSLTMQGISAGFTDIYYQYLDGMYLDIPPGTCNGQYYIVVKLDPNEFFLEENENNNVLVVPYTLTKQAGTVPTIVPSGNTALCPGESVTLTSSAAPNYLWSNGATTQSITVPYAALGSYTVSTDLNTSCPGTSVPMNVTANVIPVQIASSSNAICAGNSVTLTSQIGTLQTGYSQVSFTNTNDYSIPDNNATGVQSPITVSNINPATLTPGTVVSVSLDITHTYTGDLVLELVAPSGNKIKLSNRRGGAGDNFTGTTFNGLSATPIANGVAPFTGTFTPDEDFNLLTGNINGVWNLKVSDLAGVDTGSINNWTLNLNNLIPATLNYSWSSSPVGFSSTDSIITISPAANTTYTLTVSNPLNGCSNSASSTIAVHQNPVTAFNPMPVACTNVANMPLNAGWPTGGTYSGPGVMNNLFYPVLAGVGAHTLTYNYTDANGCSDDAVQTIQVEATPSAPSTMFGKTLVCRNSTQTYAVPVDPNATSYAWVVPSGVQIMSGQGTSSIEVSFGNNYQTSNMCVYATNSCGSSSSYCVSLQRQSNRYCAVKIPTSNTLRDDTSPVAAAQLSISPNPATDFSEVEFIGFPKGDYRLFVTDVLGKEVLVTPISLDGDVAKLPLDISTLNSGVYLVHLTGMDLHQQIKLVKN
ncbi:MAG: proprotein convertase P-domain-containing protein [Bacteroidota bacterium]